jgi:signal transduction histidine kinase
MTPRRPCRTVEDMSPKLADALVAVTVAAGMTLTISVAEEEGTREPDAVAYLLGLAVAALLLGRRQWPVGVLLGSIGVLWVYYSLDYPAFAPAVPLAAATYFAAAAGHARAAAALVAGVLVFGVGWQTLGEDASLASVLGINTLADASLLAAVLLLGETVRSRRAWADEVRARLEHEAERRAEEERLRIARELHDVMAHTIAGVTVQAGVAADVLDDDPDQAKAALRAIREGSREAMAELRATVGLLRDGDDETPRTPAPGFGELDGLADTVGGTGLDVSVQVDGPARSLPGAVELTAYRIVQESLTNVIRHARASTASVSVRYEPDAIVVRVEDDGRGSGDGPAGHGIAGMRERAAALGGTLEAGPAPRGGFRVSARLPTLDRAA